MSPEVTTMHLACPSGLAGNLFATAATRLGMPGDLLVGLPDRLRLPSAFTVAFDGDVWDGQWDEAADPNVVGGPVAVMADVVSRLLPGRCGTVAADILGIRWACDPVVNACGETWCDTLFDAAAAALALEWLGWPAVTVHGPLPREAAHPVAAAILHEWTWTPTRTRIELVTPTGAAILQVVATQTLVALDDSRCHVVSGRFTREYGLNPLRVAATYTPAFPVLSATPAAL